MNSEQLRMMEAVLIILGCFGIFTYTFTLPTHVYCDWTGLEIQERLGHEVIFSFENETTRHYCCVNVSLLAFQDLKMSATVGSLVGVSVRCPICGMLMEWNDPMIVWIYSAEYLNPTTHTATIVGVCGDAQTTQLCETHFIDSHGGAVISSPYVWP